MTDNGSAEALPTIVHCSQAFCRRLPSQRTCDLLAKLEPAGFKAIAEAQPFRLIAFQVLLRDYPLRDPTSLWLHAYDVDVDIAEEDPTSGSSPTPGLPFAPITDSLPSISTP